MAEARIDVVIGSRQAVTGANEVTRAITRVKEGFVDTAAKIFVAQQALDRVWKMANSGAAFEEGMGRLNSQMAAFHSRAQVMVADLVAVTNGQLSQRDAVNLASRALAVGLDPETVRTFAVAADAMGDVLGTSIPQAFDQITRAAATGRGQLLAQIGVFVDIEDESQKLALATGRTTEQITKQERALIAAKAITEQAGESMKRLGDGTVSEADRLGAVQAKWDDLWLSIEIGSKTAVIAALDWLAKLKKGAEDALPFHEANKIIRKLQPGHPDNPQTQEIFGRAIVADAQGRLGKAPDLPPIKDDGLPTALQAKGLEATRERMLKMTQGDLEIVRRGNDSLARLYDADAAQNLLTVEQVVTEKSRLRLSTIEAERDAINTQLMLESKFYEDRVKLGYESIQERMEVEEAHATRLVELQELQKQNDADLVAAALEGEAELDAARRETEQARGQRLMDQAQSNFQIQESLRQQEFDALQTYNQGVLAMAEARFESDADIARRERDMLRDQLAFKLRLTKEEADRLLLLRQTGNIDLANRVLAQEADPLLPMNTREGILESANAQDILLRERATNDFFAGWARGLQRYTRDTESAFGMAADMARRTAQGMEQGFQRFFFDGMEAKFQNFKDVLTGVLDFTKQIMSQMMAQFLTTGLLKPGVSGLMGIFGGGPAPTPTLQYPHPIGPFPQRFGGIMPYERFAMGGVGGGGPQMAIFNEGAQREAFVPLPDGRSIPVKMQGGGSPVQVVVNNYGNQQVTAEVRRSNTDDKQMVYVTIREAMERAIGSGDLDRTMGQNFGLGRKGVRR